MRRAGGARDEPLCRRMPGGCPVWLVPRFFHGSFDDSLGFYGRRSPSLGLRARPRRVHLSVGA